MRGWSKRGPETHPRRADPGSETPSKRRSDRIPDRHRLRARCGSRRRGRLPPDLRHQGAAGRAAVDPDGGRGVTARGLGACGRPRRGVHPTLLAGSAHGHPSRQGRRHARRAHPRPCGHARAPSRRRASSGRGGLQRPRPHGPGAARSARGSDLDRAPPGPAATPRGIASTIPNMAAPITTMTFRALDRDDPEIANLIRKEYRRQSETLELIASENLTSPAILEALGTLLTNKYAEGYPGRRYYGGTGEVIDKIESLAVDRAQRLFGAEYVNVQPHSGSQANAAVYMAVCELGDRVMGMDLSAGGHLSHGSPANFSGKFYEIHSYGVSRDTELIDYDAMEKLAQQVRPKMIIGGFSAYPRIVDWARMRSIADSVGATFMVDMAHVAGLVAGGVYPSPIQHAPIVTTTTQKTLRGAWGAIILCDTAHQKAIDSAVFPGIQGGPLMHAIAAKAVCFGEALKPDFKVYAKH